jgi:hypothetical protein
MSKQPVNLTEKQADFVSRTKEHLDTKAIEIVNEMLAVLIKEEAPFLDVHYTIQRVKQILTEKIKGIKYKDPKINDARRLRLFESICQIKEVKVRMDKDADERVKRAEPIAQQLIDTLFDVELLFSDQDYIDDAIENDDQLLPAILVDSYVNVIYDKLLIAIQENERHANERLWGKPREEITWKDIDNVLSKPK